MNFNWQRQRKATPFKCYYKANHTHVKYIFKKKNIKWICAHTHPQQVNFKKVNKKKIVEKLYIYKEKVL